VAFFTEARLGLALATARFAAAFPRATFESFLALGRAFAPFLFWTFDDCFFRLAMVDPWFVSGSQKTTDAESWQTHAKGYQQMISPGHMARGLGRI
jgi:hypothetical protein